MAIGLSLNPADVWKVFSEKGRRDKDQVAQWLDSVASEARQLSDVWRGISIELSAAEEEGPEAMADVVKKLKKIYGKIEPNSMHFYRLRCFYADASTVLGNSGRRGQSLIGVLTEGAGHILVERGKAKKIFDNYLERSGVRITGYKGGLLSTGNSVEDLDDLVAIANALDREAAALEAFAAKFHAIG